MIFNFRKQCGKIGIEQGLWYYFSVDLSFPDFASFIFLRYINVNDDRKAAVVRFLDKDYFSTRNLLLLPYTIKPDFFRAKPNEILAVWTFDASKIADANSIDLLSEWPKNILDKAAITPSIERAKQATNGVKGVIHP